MIAYLGDPERNATRAFKAAGFKGTDGAARVGAHQLLRDPRVQALIAEHEDNAVADARRRAGVNLEGVLTSIARSAYADTRKLFNEDGSIKAPHELDDETALAVEGIEVIEFGEGDAKVRKYKYRLARRSAAQDMLMKHLGGYKADDDSKGAGVANALVNLLGAMRRSALPIVQRVDHDELV